METRLEKKVRFLKIYAAVATLFCATFLAAFRFCEELGASRIEKHRVGDGEEEDGFLAAVQQKRVFRDSWGR